MGDAASLGFVREQNVDQIEQFIQYAIPSIVRIIVGIERQCKPGALEVAEELRQIRIEAALQKQRGKMKVASRTEIIEIEVRRGSSPPLFRG